MTFSAEGIQLNGYSFRMQLNFRSAPGLLAVAPDRVVPHPDYYLPFALRRVLLRAESKNDPALPGACEELRETLSAKYGSRTGIRPVAGPSDRFAAEDSEGHKIQAMVGSEQCTVTYEVGKPALASLSKAWNDYRAQLAEGARKERSTGPDAASDL
jgi:hypothetical protein